MNVRRTLVASAVTVVLTAGCGVVGPGGCGGPGSDFESFTDLQTGPDGHVVFHSALLDRDVDVSVMDDARQPLNGAVLRWLTNGNGFLLIAEDPTGKYAPAFVLSNMDAKADASSALLTTGAAAVVMALTLKTAADIAEDGLTIIDFNFEYETECPPLIDLFSYRDVRVVPFGEAYNRVRNDVSIGLNFLSLASGGVVGGVLKIAHQAVFSIGLATALPTAEEFILSHSPFLLLPDPTDVDANTEVVLVFSRISIVSIAWWEIIVPEDGATADRIAAGICSSDGDSGGVITEIIDATGDGAGHILDTPTGIAVDGAGNVYATGQISDNAFKITSAGVITQIIDATGDGAGNPLDRPSFESIAVDAADNVYVTGCGSNNAFKITPDGVITQIIDATGDGAGNTLKGPQGIAVDAAGNVYVIGQFSDNAFKIAPGGLITEIIDATGDGAGNGLADPLGIAVDAAGNTYVSGAFSDNAFKITPAGLITEIIDVNGAPGAGNPLRSPNHIAVDAAGNAYVTGADSNVAFKITPAGVITKIINITGDGAAHGLLNPQGIAVDAAGNVYVTALFSDNAFKITPAGVITQIMSANGGLEGGFGIAVDGAGNVYVTGLFSNNAFKIAGP